MADRHTTEKLLEGERLSGKVTLFAKVTILPGDELPYHEHHGETEAYHILSGAGAAGRKMVAELWVPD